MESDKPNRIWHVNWHFAGYIVMLVTAPIWIPLIHVAVRVLDLMEWYDER